MTNPNSAHPDSTNGKLEANFSTLVLSIASSAAMALGLAPHPVSGKSEKDLNLARFNIDLLTMLADKTKGNRTEDEERFLSSVLNDLKMKYVELS
jgi:hypothetical protein